MVVQLCEYTKTIELYALKGWILWYKAVATNQTKTRWRSETGMLEIEIMEGLRIGDDKNSGLIMEVSSWGARRRESGKTEAQVLGIISEFMSIQCGGRSNVGERSDSESGVKFCREWGVT